MHITYWYRFWGKAPKSVLRTLARAQVAINLVLTQAESECSLHGEQVARKASGLDFGGSGLLPSAYAGPSSRRFGSQLTQ